MCQIKSISFIQGISPSNIQLYCVKIIGCKIIFRYKICLLFLWIHFIVWILFIFSWLRTMVWPPIRRNLNRFIFLLVLFIFLILPWRLRAAKRVRNIDSEILELLLFITVASSIFIAFSFCFVPFTFLIFLFICIIFDNFYEGGGVVSLLKTSSMSLFLI